MPGKFEYAGVMPGSVTVGDIMQNTRQMQRPARAPRPMMPQKRRMQPDAIRTTVDYGMAPKMGRKR